VDGVRDVELNGRFRELVHELAPIEDAARGESTVTRRGRRTGTQPTMIVQQKAFGEEFRCHLHESQTTNIELS
jgi:hypothetical protein